MNILRPIFASLLLFPTLTALIASGDTAPASSPSINYMGRIHWDENGHGSFTYPGTTALLKFRGASLEMETSPGSGKFIVEIDDRSPVSVYYTSCDSILSLADNLTDTIHNARITYAIEGYELHPQFRSFTTDGQFMPADKKPELKIEFIGNSITCGYGIEDNDPLKPFAYDTENHTLTYAHLAARALNADYNVVARSGIGIYRNYSGPKEGTDMTMPLEYDYTMLYDHNHKWDFSKFTPDIICINLGTNDVSVGEYDMTLFENSYHGFLTHLRSLYPRATIVLLTGSMLQDPELQLIKNVLDRLAAEDNNVHRFDMSPQTGELGYGAGYHPSAPQARRMASELIPFLSTLLPISRPD